MLRTVLIVGSAVGLLVLAGVVDGVRSNRWGVPEDLQAAAARLSAVPHTVGPWTSVDLPIEQKILDRAEAVSSVSRAYRNSKNGAEVVVLLLCGPSGPIGAHTPDICYGGLGYKTTTPEARKTLTLPDGSTQTYWSARFVKTPGEPGLQVCWAWGTQGDWVASGAPRRDFALHHALYKLYASRTLGTADRDGKPGPDVVQEFLTDFLPEVKKAIAPSPG